MLNFESDNEPVILLKDAKTNNYDTFKYKKADSITAYLLKSHSQWQLWKLNKTRIEQNLLKECANVTMKAVLTVVFCIILFLIRDHLPVAKSYCVYNEESSATLFFILSRNS